MWQDPIVEEVHAIRAQLLAQFGGDVHRYCAYVPSQPTALGTLAAPSSLLNVPAGTAPTESPKNMGNKLS